MSLVAWQITIQNEFKQRFTQFSISYNQACQQYIYIFYFSELPHFIAKPSSSMTVKEKQNVTLTCRAAGFPPPVITWYKDGDIIGQERRHFRKRNLEMKEIQFEDRGIYTCTAENLLGRVQLSVNITVKGI